MVGGEINLSLLLKYFPLIHPPVSHLFRVSLPVAGSEIDEGDSVGVGGGG